MLSLHAERQPTGCPLATAFVMAAYINSSNGRFRAAFIAMRLLGQDPAEVSLNGKVIAQPGIVAGHMVYLPPFPRRTGSDLPSPQGLQRPLLSSAPGLYSARTRPGQGPDQRDRHQLTSRAEKRVISQHLLPY